MGMEIGTTIKTALAPSITSSWMNNCSASVSVSVSAFATSTTNTTTTTTTTTVCVKGKWGEREGRVYGSNGIRVRWVGFKLVAVVSECTHYANRVVVHEALHSW